MTVATRAGVARVCGRGKVMLDGVIRSKVTLLQRDGDEVHQIK